MLRPIEMKCEIFWQKIATFFSSVNKIKPKIKSLSSKTVTIEFTSNRFCRLAEFRKGRRCDILPKWLSLSEQNEGTYSRLETTNSYTVFIYSLPQGHDHNTVVFFYLIPLVFLLWKLLNISFFDVIHFWINWTLWWMNDL